MIATDDPPDSFSVFNWVGAVVRNRNVFRYGFEFDQPDAGRELIKKFS